MTGDQMEARARCDDVTPGYPEVNKAAIAASKHEIVNFFHDLMLSSL